MFDRNDRALSVYRTLAAQFIREEANTPPLITVTNAEVSSDLGHATIFVTVYPEESEDEALIFLKRKGSDFKEYVKKHGKLKFIPFFDFTIDVGEKNRQHLDTVHPE